MKKPENRGNDVGDLRPSAESGGHAVSPSGLDGSAIHEQLERILVSPPFRNSKRYPALLRYVVEKHLNGTSSELKERTIGIAVFGRDVDYDPGVDPVVRISAGEVRKRLAQYYQEAANANELRIELPVGSYQPEFLRSARELPAAPVVPGRPPLLIAGVQRGPSQAWARRRLATLSVLAVMATLVVAAFYQFARRPSALDLFWRPVLQQGNSVMLCLGHTNSGAGLPAIPSQPNDPNQRPVAWWDAATLARLTGLVESKGASARLFYEDDATFADFQQRPAVLIGAFNDRWTLEWMSHMRYTFRRSGNVQWIADRDRPDFQGWKVDLGKRDDKGNLSISQDYAIISRVANPRTGFIAVTAAGVWGYGTLAAGRFLSDPKYLEDFAKRARISLDKGDLQIVISTEVIQGKMGPPTVLASASW